MPPNAILDTNDAVRPLPEMYPVTKGTINIFSVPENNGIGTNDINDAITVLRFDKGKLEYKEVKKSFVEQVSGGDLCFMPVFSKEIIGYSQTRRFVLFNIRTGDFREYLAGNSLDDLITKVLLVDSERQLFLFEIKTFPNEKDMTKIRILKLLELTGEAPLEIASLTTGRVSRKNEPWALQGKTLVVYNGASRTLHAYDMAFKETTSALTLIFNENKKKFRWIDQLYIHPTLPFALLVDIALTERADYVVWVIRWDTKTPEIIPILGLEKEIYCSRFEFSPDGSLLLYRDETEDSKNPEYVIYPIDPKQPTFLGKPRRLGKLPRKTAVAFTSAWIVEPLSFVVTDGDILYRWNLESAARP